MDDAFRLPVIDMAERMTQRLGQERAKKGGVMCRFYGRSVIRAIGLPAYPLLTCILDGNGQGE